jgi:hypothetical protein
MLHEADTETFCIRFHSISGNCLRAVMAELADASDLGSDVARRAGSNPVNRIPTSFLWSTPHPAPFSPEENRR